jgi:hypothetical protein
VSRLWRGDDVWVCYVCAHVYVHLFYQDSRASLSSRSYDKNIRADLFSRCIREAKSRLGSCDVGKVLERDDALKETMDGEHDSGSKKKKKKKKTGVLYRARRVHISAREIPISAIRRQHKLPLLPPFAPLHPDIPLIPFAARLSIPRSTRQPCNSASRNTQRTTYV